MRAEDHLPPAMKQPSRAKYGLWLFAALCLLLQMSGCVAQRRALTAQPSLPTATTEASPEIASPTVTASPTIAPSPTAVNTIAANATAAAIPASELAVSDALRAKIEIVWPHDGATVREATQANLTAYLMEVDSFKSPPCDWEPTVRLWSALNAEPARPIAIGEKRMLDTGGRLFPVWDFNDIDVSAARDPFKKLSFFVTVDDVNTYHNIWVHAQDARTLQAEPDQPIGLLTQPPPEVDARIEIVWPHDGLPVEQAELANITTALFGAGTLDAMSADVSWDPTVLLHRSLNADAESPAMPPIQGQRRAVVTDTGDEMLVWDFNDVDVRAAQDRLNKLYFWVSVDDVTTFPNIWAHGADTPTVFPQLDVLESCR
jgi:hypothetical protein